jgi:hypothetical protein
MVAVSDPKITAASTRCAAVNVSSAMFQGGPVRHVDTRNMTEKSAHMKKTILALAALLLACLGLAVTAAAASAHTPSIKADCSGVQLDATSYETGRANTWTVTIEGATQSGTFGASFSQTFPVPQAGATTSWSARIASDDGAYDSGVQSGVVGPCGQSDACPTLPSGQPAGTECTPPPTVVRTGAGGAHGCDVVFHGREYGAGDLSYDEVFDDREVFNTSTNAWDLVTDTTGDVRNVQFHRWTKAQQVKAGCVGTPPDDTEIEEGPAAPTPSAPVSPPTQVVAPPVPTVVDAGLTGVVASEGPVASSDGSSVSVAAALTGAGLVLLLCAACTRRRPSAH